MRVTSAGLVADDQQVDIRIFGALVLGPRADFEKDRVAAGFVHEMVAVGHIGFESCGVISYLP